MAILNKLACIPSEDECTILSSFAETFEIWQPKLDPGATPQELYLLNVDTRMVVCINSDYKDVQFKFECLYLVVHQKQAGDYVFNGSIISHAKTWDKVQVILRVEWERDALPGEVPVSYDQVLQVRGKLGDVPADAPACISMVGVLFSDDGGSGLIYLDDDFPLSLGYTEDSQQIEQFLSQSINVAVDEVAVIRDQVKRWAHIPSLV